MKKKPEAKKPVKKKAVKKKAVSKKVVKKKITPKKKAPPKKPKVSDELTPKQDKACLHFLEYGNKTEAYKFAYSTGKMKPATINREAKELFDDPKITTRLEELMQPILDKFEATQEKTIKRLMQGQEFDFRKLYDKTGKLKKPHLIDEDTAKAIVGVTHDILGNVSSYKIIDVKGCSELVGKHLKMFTTKIDVNIRERANLLKDVLTDKELEEAMIEEGLGNFIK